MNTDVVNRVIELAIQIQQIPAPTFQERKRAEFVQGLFLAERLNDVCIDETGNVFARLIGKGERKPLIVSAHLDTVFPGETDLSCLLYTSPSPRDRQKSRMPSSA